MPRISTVHQEADWHAESQLVHGTQAELTLTRRKRRKGDGSSERTSVPCFFLPSFLPSIRANKLASSGISLGRSVARSSGVGREGGREGGKASVLRKGEDGGPAAFGCIGGDAASLPPSVDRKGKAHAWNDKETVDGRSMERKNALTDEGGREGGTREGGGMAPTNRKVAAAPSERASERASECHRVIAIGVRVRRRGRKKGRTTQNIQGRKTNSITKEGTRTRGEPVDRPHSPLSFFQTEDARVILNIAVTSSSLGSFS